jgi:peptide/nickel transport system ATP-binding protein
MTAMLEMKGLSKRFVKHLDLAGRVAQRLGSNIAEEVVHAVDGVDMAIQKGEVVALVGESGCCKSTLAAWLPELWSPATAKFFTRATTSRP